MRRVLLIAALTALGCAAEPGTATDVIESTESTSAALSANCPENRAFHLYPGPTSWEKKYGGQSQCVASQYDCDMPGGLSRYHHPSTNEKYWPIAKNITVLDGQAKPLAINTGTETQLNFGIQKRLKGEPYVYAFAADTATGHVSGWVPAACIGWNGSAPSSACESKSGTLPKDYPVINGRRPSAKYDATKRYEIDPTPTLPVPNADDAKVICNVPAGVEHKSLADYVPHQNPDGSYAINLVQTLPGMSPALGGLSADTFRVGHLEGGTVVSDHVRFFRLIHVRSVAVYLFKPAPKGTEGAWDASSRVAFVYGYVVYDDGAGHKRRRYGWICASALT